MKVITRRDALAVATAGALATTTLSSVASADVVSGKVRNSTGKEVVVGLFGMDGAATFRATLSPGDIMSVDFITGERAIVVWDDFTETIDYVASITIDATHKKIDLKAASATVTKYVHFYD